MLGLGVADSTAGYRCYSARILRQLDLERIRAEGYGFQIEMTYRAKQHGGGITEVPISFVDRAAGESKMSSSSWSRRSAWSPGGRSAGWPGACVARVGAAATASGAAG